MECPKCTTKSNQYKDGFTQAGSQRYRCGICGARYTPEKKDKGYGKAIRKQAIRMYSDGLGFRQIGRQMEVHHTSVMNWVKEHAEKLPEAPVPEDVYTVEMDELYTFIADKKTGSTS